MTTRAAFLALISLVLFALLAAGVTMGVTTPFDMGLRNAIHNTATAPLTLLAFGFSFLGTTGFTLAVAAIAAVIFFRRGDSAAAKSMAAVMAGALILNYGLKYLFHRPRPEAFFGALPDTYSFPSGHVLFSGCCYGMLTLCLAARRPDMRAPLFVAAVILVAAIGWSRQYLGVHYPSDVLAGGACRDELDIPGSRKMGLRFRA